LLIAAIAKAYREKRLNDFSLTASSIQALFAFVHSLSLIVAGTVWILGGAVAFLLWKAVFYVYHRMRPRGEDGINLLLLRVFALGKRSEALFDRLNSYWRELGPIQLIAGPDLAATTLEPDQMLAFVKGKLSEAFCRSSDEVENRVHTMDLLPDVDGRFRFNQLFCSDSVWQLALSKLLSTSHVVLMDLRSFSPQNVGCLYEIQVLLGSVPIERMVLLTDDTTDQNFLRDTLAREMQQISASSPNVGQASPRVFNLQTLNDRTFHKLLDTLAAACTASTYDSAGSNPWVGPVQHLDSSM
jgi:hypothetical protein